MTMLKLGPLVFLSLSGVLDALVFLKECKPTSPDVYGPYYLPYPPPLAQFCKNDPKTDEDEPLLVYGTVYKEDCETPIPFTRLEIWQANHDGKYKMSTDCRGFLYTDHNGYFEFKTIHPGKYSTDPEKHLYRPSHLHFKIFGEQGHKDLVTQMYFYGDSNLGRNDSCHVCSSDKQDLIVKPETLCDSKGNDCIDVAKFDIVLERGIGISVTYADYDYEYK